MANIRKNRWATRGVLKDDSNRRGSLDAEHPSSRRQIEGQLDQFKDLTAEECGCGCHFSDFAYRGGHDCGMCGKDHQPLTEEQHQ